MFTTPAGGPRPQSIAVLLMAATGCVFESSPIVPAPIPPAEQQWDVLQIVKPGTSRDEAIARLEAAGIEGTFGTAKSVYYCDVWNREDGERWHLDVAVLFDAEGRVINTRMGNTSRVDPLAAVEPATGTDTAPTGTAATDTRPSRTEGGPSVFSPPPTATAPPTDANGNRPSERTPRWKDRRKAFVDDE